MTGPDHLNRPDEDPSSATAASGSRGPLDPHDDDQSFDNFADGRDDAGAAAASRSRRGGSTPYRAATTAAAGDPANSDTGDRSTADRSATDPEPGHRPDGLGDVGTPVYGNAVSGEAHPGRSDADAAGSDNTGWGSTGDSDPTTVVPISPPATVPAGPPAYSPMTPPTPMPAWQSASGGSDPGMSGGPTSAVAAEPGTFFGQPSRTPEPDVAPPKSRIWQNLLGAVAGLVLILGPVILFALLAGTPDSLFEQSTGRRLVVLGLIVAAALPALLAGWAPAAAWLPGAILAVVGTIALFSQSFVDQLQTWSTDVFNTSVVGVFVTNIGLYLGFALLFAGLGTVWARRSGVDSVLDRISPRP